MIARCSGYCFAGYLAVAFVQVGLLGHDVAHHQVVRSRRWNAPVGLILGPLLLGTSRAWWRDNHNTHHAHPNDLERDPNVDILVLAYTPNRRALDHAGLSA